MLIKVPDKTPRKDWGVLTPAQHKEFWRKANQEFRGHRPLPPGRVFGCWEHEHQPDADAVYRENFDKAFPDAPGGSNWWKKRMAQEDWK